tara:strand:+ start:402 stop:857 length:456 start_codon:yes stop_codon:yes gene_type:complete
MAITISTAMPTSFKVELLKGLHDLQNGADTLKIALLKATASGSGTYGAATTNYSTVTGNSDETSGSGYSAGGNTLTNITPVASSTTAVCDFNDTTWSSASFTTCGAVIYNTNNSNSAVAVLSFGGDQTVSTGDFQIQFPAAGASTAIIRIA